MSEEKQYAVIRTGGKQYRVSQGDTIEVELLGKEGEDQVSFKEVLLVAHGSAVRVGKPLVEGCIVKGELLAEVKGPKVIAYRFKRRKNYHRKVGHRQRYDKVKITAIEG
ncbi:MAG: 50S ribosomal protein L21 [Verrucomicrobia bacterium]|nr:50S ribosomal protein L21 [Verrucomicrobiota bacterium]